MLKRGLAFSIGLQAINGISPLLLLPISLRRLGPDAYGVYVHAMAISNLLAGVLVLGFSAHLSRLYIRETSEEKAAPFARLVAFQFALAICATLLNLLAVILFIEMDRKIYLAAALNTLFAAFNVDWYYYSRTNIQPLFWRTLAARTTIIGLAALWVVDSHDLLLFTSLIVASTGIANLAGLAWAWKSERIKLRAPTREDFVSSRYFFASGVIGSIQQFADQILVGTVFSKADLAHLSLCRQVLSACAGFTQAVCRVLLPLSVKNLLEAPGDFVSCVMQRARLFALGSAGVALAIAALAAPALQALSNGRFTFDFGVMLVCGACFLATSSAVYIDTQISIPTAREHVTTRSNIVVATCFLLGLAAMTLVPGLNYQIALVSLLCAELLGSLTMIFLHRRLGTFGKGHQ